MIGLMNHFHQNLYLFVCELPHLGFEPSDVQRGAVRLVGCYIVFHYIVMMFFFHYSWTIAASCAFGSRLLLNIRERYFKEQSFIGVETKPLFKSSLSSV
jgi:hypothetical protein